MEKLMAKDISFLDSDTNYEITIDIAKELYLTNSLFRYDDKLLRFVNKNLSSKEIFELNNKIILDYINNVNKILSKENTKENLYEIAIKYSDIKHLFTDSLAILNSLYDLYITLINKYGHTSLCFIDLVNIDRGNFYLSFLPIINCIYKYMHPTDLTLTKFRYYAVEEYALLSKDEYESFGLLANAYYLNNQEMVDKIFNNIIIPHFNNYYNTELNIDINDNITIYNKDINHDLFYIELKQFIDLYNLDYKI